MAIAGGGLAGLSAAASLASRGVPVTVIEAGPRPGGKLTAWRDADGATVEHGMHGWWTQYRNFFDLMARTGVASDTLLDPTRPAWVHPDGAFAEVELPQSRLPSPLFLLWVARSLRKMGLLDRTSGGWALLPALGFDPGRDFDRYDSVSLYDLLERRGASRALHDQLAAPLCHSFGFASTKEVSAASFLGGLAFYLVGHQNDILVRWCRGNPQERIVDPIAAYVAAHGGEVRSGAVVESVSVGSDERATGLVLKGVAGEMARIPLAEIPATDPLRRDLAGGRRLFVRRVSGGFLALDAACTHMGCLVDLASADHRYHCPCHGAIFDLDGAVRQGPATEPLPRFDTRVDGSDLVVSGAGGGGGTVAADHIVLALDAPAAGRLIAGSHDLLHHDDLRRVLELRGTGAMVARLWLDKRLPDDAPTSGAFTSSELLDNFTVLSRLQDEFKGDVGTVMEVHMYRVAAWRDLHDDDVKEHVVEELRRRFPALAGTGVRKAHLSRHAPAFPLWSPGSNAFRPGTRCSVPNVFFAGDWIRADGPWWWMEKAVATGRLAANAVLQAEGLEPVEVLQPEPDEPFVWAMKALSGAGRSLRRGIARLFGIEPLDP